MFNEKQMINIFERFASDEQLMGKKKVKAIIEHLGVDSTGNILARARVGDTVVFTDDVYEDFFERISQDDWVSFQVFLPFLQVCFISKIVCAVEQRRNHYRDIL